MTSHKSYASDAVYKYLTPSLQKLAGDGDGAYIDLMLLHAPFGGKEGRANNWAALVRAQKEGWVKDIGVSNLFVRSFPSSPSGILSSLHSTPQPLRSGDTMFHP